MVDYTETNKKWWNAITPIHSRSSLYNLKKFKKGATSLQQIEIKELENIKNKKILHLLCHFGMDSLSLARRGAKVTGVDVSEESIKLAQSLSNELHIPAEFICSDVYALPKVLNKKYDIIFMSYGVLLWLSDLKKFGNLINHFLKKGGIFYIVELHPFTNILSHDFTLQYDYFDKGPFLDDADGSYSDWNDTTKGKTYEWSYTIEDIFSMLHAQNLKIEFFHEFPYTMYDQFPGFMRKNAKGQYVLKDTKAQIPLLFSLKAVK